MGEKILIITGGHLDVAFAEEYLKGKHFDRIITADAGLSSCRKLRRMPTDVLGDFDSLADKRLLSFYEEQGVPVRIFPTRKDYTDTHLAVACAMDSDPEEIILLGATGSRYDHTLANIGMLEKMARKKIAGKIVDKYNEIEMLCGKREKEYRKRKDRDFFSLMAWGGEVTGITLTGFAYPLHEATLHPSDSVGISNELKEETAVLRMEQGNLLVIRSSD